MSQKDITISSILQELSHMFDGVVAERDVYDQVLQRRPSQAKDPYASIRNQIRYQAASNGWVRLGRGKIMPLHSVLRGLRFRLIPGEDDVANGTIARWSLRPFLPYARGELRLVDAEDCSISVQEAVASENSGVFGLLSTTVLQLEEWFTRTGFVAGDSILLTIEATEPVTFRLEREAAAQFRADDVAAQEQEFLDQLAAWIKGGSGRGMTNSEDAVLGIYGQAAWRTSYPGRPWQQLVAGDRRLGLMDGELIVEGGYRSPLDMLMGGGRDEQQWQEADAELLDAIKALQAELLASRRAAVERGVWDGTAPRASTARTIFNMQEGTAETLYSGPVDATQDHSADIEEHVAHGDYAEEEWDDADELDDIEDWGFEVDDELFEVEDLDDLQMFMQQNPSLAAATRQLLDTLSPEDLERLHEAESFDEVNEVLSRHLSDLMRTQPSLFEALQPPGTLLPTNGTASNGHNGNNGHSGNNGHVAEALLGETPLDFWYDDVSDNWVEQEERGDVASAEAALDRSNDLMEAFYQYQTSNGKSETTATNRTRDLWMYADFLGNYYGRSLDAGDYSTLDECLFFYYPRKVLGSSPRALREMCTSLKQFYAFLKAKSRIADDAFAVAIWQRRDQVGRVLELYDQIDSDSPQFERLFAHLFAPYTA